MPTTNASSGFAPASAYPDSPFLVSQPRSWSAGRPAIIIVASDGTVRSDGALRVALARAADTNAGLEVVTVARYEPVDSPESMTLWREDNATRRGTQRRAVEAQLVRITGKPRVHGVTVLDGNPAFTISRVAIERHAALVIVGLGRHALADRLFSDETALQLARISRVPVLAVPEDAVTSARHVVVAVDFGEISDRAAQSAIDAVGEEGLVELVHVLPGSEDGTFTIPGQELAERSARRKLDALAGRLAAPAGVTLTRVAGKLLRGSHCAVLAVSRDPLPALEPAHRWTAGLAPRPAPAIWIELLASFSKRNAGRRTILEVDDLELGAPAQEYNYPLIGTAYDDRSARVELMVGDATASGRHLTRSIGGVTSVDVLTDGEGHDVALRVQHGISQTLLTFAA